MIIGRFGDLLKILDLEQRFTLHEPMHRAARVNSVMSRQPFHPCGGQIAVRLEERRIRRRK